MRRSQIIKNADILGNNVPQGSDVRFHFITTIREHTDIIKCLAFCNARLWSAGYDKAIRTYDPDRLNEPATKKENCHSAGICNVRPCHPFALASRPPHAARQADPS